MIVTAKQLAEEIGASLVGDGTRKIGGVARIETAEPDQVTFIANPTYLKYLASTQAGAVILREPPESVDRVYLVTDEPYIAFLKALRLFHPEPPRPEPGVHPTAVIAANAKIGDNVYIGPGCVVEDGVEIGDGTLLRAQVFLGHGAQVGRDCMFYSHVAIRENCRIGDRVLLQNGVVIGGDGFGFAPQDAVYVKIPQVGIVVIEDDVEIGANSTVDRATIGETRICRGVKIDNLVQVAHNVQIGENTVIAAQCGIAGSARIGRGVMLGGQVGINGHIKISDGVIVAAQSGIHKDPGQGKIVGGYPARDIGLWRRIEAVVSHLPELMKRVQRLEKKAKE